MKRIKIRALEGLSVFVVRLHVKGRFPVKYLSSRNEISDFNIYTAIGVGVTAVIWEKILSKTTIWILSETRQVLP